MRASIEVVADLGDSDNIFLSDQPLFDISFEYHQDDDGCEISITGFNLKTGLKKLFRGKEIEILVPMPKESYDFAEKIIWAKIKDSSEFLEMLANPEMAECGHDAYID